MKKKFKVFLLFLLIPIIAISGFIFAYFSPLSWGHLQHFYARLIELERDHPILTPFVFMSAYILYTLLSLPGIFLFSLVAGCLFIQPFSTLYVTCAATIGASLLFLLARTAFGSFFYSRNNYLLGQMEQGFRKNAVSYLLFLRLIPMSPFWMINISGAFFKVPFWTFVWTTFFGMIPSVIIYTQAGKELALFLDSAAPLSPAHLFNPYLVTTLIGMALLTLVPIFFKSSKTSF